VQDFDLKEESVALDVKESMVRDYLVFPTTEYAKFIWITYEEIETPDAILHLRGELNKVALPNWLTLCRINDRKHMFDAPKSVKMKERLVGTSDVVMTLARLLRENILTDGENMLTDGALFTDTFLIIELKPKLEPKHAKQAQSILLAACLKRRNERQSPVVLLTDLHKGFQFFWIGNRANQKYLHSYTTNDGNVAMLLMAAVSIEEARRLGKSGNHPPMPQSLATLPIFNRSIIKGTIASISEEEETPNVHMDLGGVRVSAASSTSTSSSQPQESGGGKEKKKKRLRGGGEDEDDRYHVNRSVYLQCMRDLGGWSEQSLYRPMSPDALNMYV